MAALVELPISLTDEPETEAEAGPSRPNRPTIRALPFQLDLTCPIGIPSKHTPDLPWPFSTAGPVLEVSEPVESFVRRRYYESVYLSELLAPLSGLVSDLDRISPPSPSPSPSRSQVLVQLLEPYLLSLPQIERRYRTTVSPVIGALMSMNPNVEAREAALRDAVTSAGLTHHEVAVLRTAVELRWRSKAVEEGERVVHVKKLTEEFERRETLVQIVFLLIWITETPYPAPLPKKKRPRPRHRNDGVSPARSPKEDPGSALELLMDRLSVWQAVAELGIGLEDDKGGVHGKAGAKGADDGVANQLRSFWDEVILPFFVKKQPSLCSSFHLKVFGTPIPAKLLPPSAIAKKPRKPKITHPKPSSDDLVPAPVPLLPGASTSRSRAPSRTPSEAGSRASPPRDSTDVPMRRSLSRTSDARSLDHFRRSRSASTGPALSKDSSAGLAGLLPPPAKKTIVRAPSGKDLFKGREVGLRRTTSMAARKGKESQKMDSQTQIHGQTHGSGAGQSQTAIRGGLLGRKTSDPIKRTGESQLQSQSQSQSQSLPHNKPTNTIIFATPSKPRLSNSIFGPRAGSGVGAASFHHPTPIQEEPSSGERASWVAETPVAPHRIAETPMAGHRTANASLAGVALTEDDDDSDDPLADLMVMTDEEDGDGDDNGEGMDEDLSRAMIPETPAR